MDTYFERHQGMIILLLGIFLILISLLFSKKIGGKEIEIKADKIGVYFKSDGVLLPIVLGFILIGSGIFIRIKNYGEEIEKLAKSIEERNGSISVYDRNIMLLKDYNIGVRIVFPDSVRVSTIDTSKIQVVIKEPGASERIYNNADPIVRERSGSFFASLHSLKAGSTIFFSYKDAETNTTYKCNQFEVPVIWADMKVVNTSN